MITKLYKRLFISGRFFSIWKSIFYNMIFFNKLKMKLFVGSNTTILKKSNSFLNINGKLFIDSKNDGQFWYYSHLRLLDNSSLIINGNVNFFSGLQLKCFENSKVTISDGTYFSGPITIHSKKEISIGKNCSVSWNCTIIDSDFHSIDDASEIKSEKVKIGNKVWIGNNVTILKGVQVGDNAIIAANSLVNKDIEENGIYGGNPAKLIRYRNDV